MRETEKEKKQQERIKKKKEKEELTKKTAEGKAKKVSHQKKQPKCKRSVTLEATESSAPLQTCEETVILDSPVTPTAERDIIQVARPCQNHKIRNMNVVSALEHSVLDNQAEWAMCACAA